jgi:hypothetical protein
MMDVPDWVVRVKDGDVIAPAVDPAKVITEALEAVGFEVLSVKRPFRMNEQPLRIRSDDLTRLGF